MGATSAARRAGAAALAILAGATIAGCGSTSSAATSHRTAQASAPAMTSGASTTTMGSSVANGSSATTGSSTGAGSSTAAGSQPGPERVPLEAGSALAPASTTAPGTTVDGVWCSAVEQLKYHIHAHLQVYVDGRPQALPGAIGLLGAVPQETPVGPFYGATQCYYWLHTHTSDGVIHVESPTARIYTLGNFFDEWRQPLGPNRVAASRGRLTAYINGKRWTTNPRQIPLLPHAVIQLDVGAPAVPFRSMSWTGSVL